MALQTKTLTDDGSKGYHKFTLTVSEDSITTATNISTMSFVFKISPIVSGYNWISYSNIKYSIDIGGTPYSGTILNYDGSSTVTLKSGSLPITHDSNGDKTIDISFTVTDPNTSVSYTCGPASASDSMTLTKIARASSLSLSASSVDVGESITANITPADTSFTHTVEFYINSSYSQSYTGVSTSQVFTIPTSWYDYMSSSTNCTAYCRLTTYSGSTQVGDQIVKSFTVNVPSSIKPNITESMITLTPAAVNGNNILIKGKNKLTISVSGCSAGTGSAIKSYTFSGPSISTTLTSASATTSTVSATGTLTYTVTATDTRGRTNSASKTITCYDYYAPSFTSFDVYRADSDGNANINGTYLKCTYAISYASVNSTNSTTVTLKYTTGSESEEKTMSGGSALINLGNATSSYQVSATVTDSYGGSAPSSTLTVFGDARILNITSDGTGFAIGKMAESSNLFECRWDAKFDSGIDVNSNKITSVATPTANTDAANKKYVDDTVGSYTHKNASLNPACIEFTGATGHGGYIDFHYSGSTADYTSRIIESSSGVVTLNNSPIVTPAAPNGFYYLGVKSSLPSGADFNTYITPGQWATNTYNTASTFSNCPYVTAGSLTVYYSDTTTNELHQIWETRDYKVYERYSSNGGSTWSTWNKRLTSANVVAIYSAAVTFSSGVATYTHSDITASSIVIVQRRSGSVGNNQQFNVHSNAGSVTICTTSTISATLNLNIIIINN